MIEEWSDTCPELARWLEEPIAEVLAVFALPEALRNRLRTTNGSERYPQEDRWRSRVIRIFQTVQVVPGYPLQHAMEQTEDWLTGPCYLNMQVLEEQSWFSTAATSTNVLAKEAVMT